MRQVPVAGLLSALLKDPEANNDPAKLSKICLFANAVGAITTTQRREYPLCRIEKKSSTLLI
ncbi:MAG: sugar/nucleoside kinase (ribokinase family) [Gammaproteobacteria bacterium]|jgi:sugar/nucleoside kinase (ribokinase family)